MTIPVITGMTQEPRSKASDRQQCCWHVRYQFCDLSAEITVYANNEVDARTEATDQLRRRGLKLPSAA